MHEDLTSYDCIIIIFTAILYFPIKVKKKLTVKKRLIFNSHSSSYPQITIMNIIIIIHHHHNEIDGLGISAYLSMPT